MAKDKVSDNDIMEESNIDQINNLISDDELEVKEDKENYKAPAEEVVVEQESPKPKKVEVKKPAFKPRIEKKKIHIKKIVKKIEKRPVRKVQEKSNYGWVWIVIGIAIIIVVAIVLFSKAKISPVTNETISEIAATVNGEAIYMSDIDNAYQKVAPEMRPYVTPESVLNQTIDEVLLLQETNARNIKVSAVEVKTEIDNFKKENNLNDQQLEAVLQEQNLTMKDLQLLIEKRLRVRELLNRTILTNIQITAEEIEGYYDDNRDKFLEAEKVTVSHILLAINDTNDEEQKARIMAISQELTDTNFCELVRKYSQDPGSINTCGTYTFGRNEMVPEFENASFRLGINNTAIVRSEYGWHIIKKLAHAAERTASLEDLYDQINQSLKDAKAQENFEKLLSDLRSKAVIINYLNKPKSNITMTGNIVVNTEVETKTVATVNLDSFAKCLTSKNVKFYGAYWCPHCNNQKELFGESFQYISYVECAEKDNPQVQTATCNSAEISGYPTWVINEQKYAGEQTLADLERLSGCSI